MISAMDEPRHVGRAVAAASESDEVIVLSGGYADAAGEVRAVC